MRGSRWFQFTSKTRELPRSQLIHRHPQRSCNDITRHPIVEKGFAVHLLPAHVPDTFAWLDPLPDSPVHHLDKGDGLCYGARHVHQCRPHAARHCARSAHASFLVVRTLLSGWKTLYSIMITLPASRLALSKLLLSMWLLIPAELAAQSVLWNMELQNGSELQQVSIDAFRVGGIVGFAIDKEVVYDFRSLDRSGREVAFQRLILERE